MEFNMTIADELALIAQTKEALRIVLDMPKSAPFSTYVNSNYIYTPVNLFSTGEQGVFYLPEPENLFQNTTRTSPVTVSGDPMGGITDLSGNGNHGTQTISSRRPIYNSVPDRLTLDKVDDAIVVNVPTGGWIGTMVLATSDGTASYGVNLPAGNHEIGGIFFPGSTINGLVLREGTLSTSESDKAEQYFVSKGAKVSYGDVVNLKNAWRKKNLTSFPLIDTSSATSVESAWERNELTSFPLIDTSSATNCSYAWFGNPLVDFPANMFDDVKGGNFTRAFEDTNLNQASIDGILVSLVTSGIATGRTRFLQSGGSVPSATGNTAIDTLRSRGWTVTVTGGY